MGFLRSGGGPGVVVDEDSDDPFRGLAVPEWGRAVAPRRLVEAAKGLIHDPGGLGADDPVGAVGHRGRTFGRVSKGQARDYQEGRFFLDAPRIRENQTGAAHEGDEIEITKGVEVGDPLAVKRLSRIRHGSEQISLAEELLLDPRVNGEHDRDVSCQLLEGVEEIRQAEWIVDVRRSVEGQDDVRVAVIETEATDDR